jgi:hypothetical protein
MFSAKILGFFGYSYCRPVLLPRSVTRSISPEISSVAGLRSGIAAFIGDSFSHGRSALRDSLQARVPVFGPDE